MNKEASKADGNLNTEEDEAINESQSLGFWYNRLFLLLFVLVTYSAGIKFVDWPNFTTLYTLL